LSIAIIGGGPGGLTLARLLQLQGMQVSVYERDAHANARSAGATLDLHDESGLAALQAAGLMPQFMGAYRPGADALRLTDAAGTIRYEDAGGSDGSTFRPEIDRGPLMQLLLDSLEPGTVSWGYRFASLEEKGSGWNIHFQDREAVFADLVIGADGANSRIRPYITNARPVYSGITVLEGQVADAAERVPQIHALLNGGKIFALGHSQSLIISSKGDGSLYFYTGSVLPEEWATGGIDFQERDACLRWFRESFSGWSPLWEPLFEAATMPLTPRPQYAMPPDQLWQPKPNLSLIGDAAHLMPPYAGEGVNMAMLDALELSDALGRYDSSVAAIAAYQQTMLARATAVTKATLEQTAAMHAPGALEALLRFFNEAEGRVSDKSV
jgi:2-polyprenyl-6-methoxyphenol hydroxylase-like FAD-dependent oxidoreductase